MTQKDWKCVTDFPRSLYTNAYGYIQNRIPTILLMGLLQKPDHPSAKVRILVLGNSISHRATKILRPIFEDNKEVKEMRLFAQSGKI